MSDKDRRKKGGERKDKKNERMREDVKTRHEQGEANAKETGVHTDQGDMFPKPNPQTIEGPSRPS
jgi:hypothetical protein